MKFGVATSSVLHAALLSWGLLNLSAPEVETFELSGVEIDFETSNVTLPAQGEKEADVTAKPTIAPTKKPERDPEANNIGDADTDEKSVERENPGDKVVEKSATAPEPEKAVEVPDVAPEAKPEDAPTPATELAAVNDPATPITDALPDENPITPTPSIAEQQIAALPEALPVPTAKPKPPKPNTAKTQERKQSQDKPTQSTADARKEDQQEIADKILNNKTTEESASGGQKESTQTASLGDTQSNFRGELSQREEDQLRGIIERCSRGTAGGLISPDFRIKVVMYLNRDGTLKGRPKIEDYVGGTADEHRRYGNAMLRHLQRCAPYDFLPPEKYETWKEIAPTFYIAEMFE